MGTLATEMTNPVEISAKIRTLLEQHDISVKAFSDLILGTDERNGPENMSDAERKKHYERLKKWLRRASPKLVPCYNILLDYLDAVPNSQKSIEHEIQNTRQNRIPHNFQNMARGIGKEIREHLEEQITEYD